MKVARSVLRGLPLSNGRWLLDSITISLTCSRAFLIVLAWGTIQICSGPQAHVDERESLWDLVPGIHGVLIADKGLIGADYQNELREYSGIDLQTAVRSNMEDKRPKRFIRWLTSTRRLIETVIGQLADRFQLEKVRARKLWYLTNRVARKVLAHTVCVFINKKMGNPSLKFELLIKS